MNERDLGKKNPDQSDVDQVDDQNLVAEDESEDDDEGEDGRDTSLREGGPQTSGTGNE